MREHFYDLRFRIGRITHAYPLNSLAQLFLAITYP